MNNLVHYNAFPFCDSCQAAVDGPGLCNLHIIVYSHYTPILQSCKATGDASLPQATLIHFDTEIIYNNKVLF